MSDNNYDRGSRYLDDVQHLTVMAPTEAGLQPFNSESEVAVSKSHDGGASWQLTPLTFGSPYNHTCVHQAVDAAPEFYSFWANRRGRKPFPFR